MPTALSASVVFLRIQDFARRPASEQARLRAQLDAVLAVTATTASSCARNRACSLAGRRAKSWMRRNATLAENAVGMGQGCRDCPSLNRV